MGHDQDDASRRPVGHVLAVPAPPSTLPELSTWIGAVRKLLRGQEDRPIGGSRVVHLPMASNEPDEPPDKPYRLCPSSLAYRLRERFLEHVERLCPEDWPRWFQEFQPERRRTVRELVTMMFLIEQRIGGKAGKGGKRKTKGKPGPKGPRNSLEKDREILEGWNTWRANGGKRSVETYAKEKHGATNRKQVRAVELAIGREKARRKRQGQNSRDKSPPRQ